METQERIINRDLVIGWASIVVILFVSYIGEVIKHERSVPYFLVFMLFTAVPCIVTIVLYRKNPSSHIMRYFIVVGYFFMYSFVMLTGKTTLVFTYIFPMLSLIVLYHQERLILGMGIAALIVNAISIATRFLRHEINLSNSKDIEIQLALLFLCFIGCYTAAQLQKKTINQNSEYIQMLNETSSQIQNLSLQSITTIANTIDAKDEYTKGHSQRVAEYSSALARELGMSEEECSNIHKIALLHDIGKIGVPDSILNKPGKLTDEEFFIMKQHPTVGGDILKDIRLLPDLDVGAKYHHERYDGRGYPSGLKGEEIPLIARIICIADSYDAMSSNRVYRKGLADDWILAEIERCKGAQFDPKLADAFLNLLHKKKIQRTNSYESQIQEEMMAAMEQSNMASSSHRIRSQDILDELADINRIRSVEFNITQELKYEDGCLLLIDVNNLDEINQKYGRLRGDYCLGTIARMLLKPKRGLIVSRAEGDEFLCYIPSINTLEEAEKKILALMNDLNDEIAATEALEGISLSAGASLSFISGKEYAQLLMDADKALYHIKKHSRSGFFIYSDKPKNDYSYTNENDLHQLLELLQKETQQNEEIQKHQEFSKIYDFIQDVEKQNGKNMQLILFSLKPKSKKTFDIQNRIMAMNLLESAITKNIRATDDTTRYSRTQQLVIFKNLDEAESEHMINQITKVFYRMYDKHDVVITYDTANLNIH